MTNEEKIKYLKNAKEKLKSSQYNIEDILLEMPEELCKEFYLFMLDILKEESIKKEKELRILSIKKGK